MKEKCHSEDKEMKSLIKKYLLTSKGSSQIF